MGAMRVAFGVAAISLATQAAAVTGFSADLRGIITSGRADHSNWYYPSDYEIFNLYGMPVSMRISVWSLGAGGLEDDGDGHLPYGARIDVELNDGNPMPYGYPYVLTTEHYGREGGVHCCLPDEQFERFVAGVTLSPRLFTGSFGEAGERNIGWGVDFALAHNPRTGRVSGAVDFLEGYWWIETLAVEFRFKVLSGTIAFDGTDVPEPATWTMLIAGFGFVGAGLRLKRRRSRGQPPGPCAGHGLVPPVRPELTTA